MLLDFEKRPRPILLALAEETHLIGVVRHQPDVPQVPVVVVETDERGLLHRRAVLFQPVAESFGGGQRRTRIGYELRVVLRQALAQIAIPANHAGRRHGTTRLALVDAIGHLELADGLSGQLAGRVGEIRASLLDDPRHGLQLRTQPLEALPCRRDVGVGRAPNQVHVEAGITLPWPHHPMIEVQSVQLGAHEVIVHLLRHRPRGRVDRGQPLSKRVEPAALLGDCRRRVVGNAGGYPWRPQLHKFLVNADESLVRLGALAADGRTGGGGKRHCYEHECDSTGHDTSSM
jgi:hypothetical protein